MEEQEIINGLKNGDDTCFLKVVDEYKKKVISLCITYTHNYHDAEDISQDVFLKLYRSIDFFRGDCSLSTYIYKITVSKCLDYKRKGSFRKFLTGLFEVKDTVEEDLEEKNFIRECIEGLKDDLKLPIVLYYYVGLNQREIGEILNISEKAVEGRIYRGKKKLKEILKEGGDELCKANMTL